LVAFLFIGMNFKSIILLGFLVCIFHYTIAQNSDSIWVDSLLNDIYKEQVSVNADFKKGSFPSFRQYGWGWKLKKDPNIFFTSLIVYTLNQIKPKLIVSQQAKVEQITKNALEAFPFYKNKKGRNSYNFWETNPPILFPNSLFLSHLSKKKALADDPDDTVFPIMVQPNSDSILRQVHDLLRTSSNGFEGKHIKNTFKRYRNFKAHSAWFGKKMPIEFDFSLQCNTLLFLIEKKLTWNDHDSATLALLIEMVKNKEYLKHPAYISPYYQKTAVIFYHLSRLMSKANIPALEALKPTLIVEAKKLSQEKCSPLEKILINTSLLRWGEKGNIPKKEIVHWKDEKFAFYTVRLMTYWAEPWKSLLMKTGGLLKYNWYCEAYNQTLCLENLILQLEVEQLEVQQP
jgi:hypothetical protein